MKQAISTTTAPAAIGPYSQGTAAAGLIFTSGQLPIDPATDSIAEGIAAQTLQSLRNVSAVLEAGGSSTKNILKTTVFLKNMDDFSAMNAVYTEFFGNGVFPARRALEAARLPKDALLEIEAIATAGDK
jgi:2-iminobutanoate/2-iminopropanoate deaminase